jgi:hypothetical protein
VRYADAVDDPDNVPGEGRLTAIGTVAMAIGFVWATVRLAPKPEAVVTGVLVVVFAGLTVFVWRNPPTWG